MDAKQETVAWDAMSDEEVLTTLLDGLRVAYGRGDLSTLMLKIVLLHLFSDKVEQKRMATMMAEHIRAKLDAGGYG